VDRNPPELIAGQVKVHPAVAGIIKEFGQGGWIAATFLLNVKHVMNNVQFEQLR
jgi:hypothetical protein